MRFPCLIPPLRYLLLTHTVYRYFLLSDFDWLRRSLFDLDGCPFAYKKNHMCVCCLAPHSFSLLRITKQIYIKCALSCSRPIHPVSVCTNLRYHANVALKRHENSSKSKAQGTAISNNKHVFHHAKSHLLCGNTMPITPSQRKERKKAKTTWDRRGFFLKKQDIFRRGRFSEEKSKRKEKEKKSH